MARTCCAGEWKVRRCEAAIDIVDVPKIQWKMMRAVGNETFRHSADEVEVFRHAQFVASTSFNWNPFEVQLPVPGNLALVCISKYEASGYLPDYPRCNSSEPTPPGQLQSPSAFGTIPATQQPHEYVLCRDDHSKVRQALARRASNSGWT
jgi:hypothetical protein